MVDFSMTTSAHGIPRYFTVDDVFNVQSAALMTDSNVLRVEVQGDLSFYVLDLGEFVNEKLLIKVEIIAAQANKRPRKNSHPGSQHG